MLNYYPSSNHISQNPVFLLEYPRIKLGLNGCERIYLKDQKGNQTDLEIIDGYGTKGNDDYQNRYVLLKPTKKLRRNAVVSIIIDLNCKVSLGIRSGFERLSKKTWIVSHKKDNIPPTFKSNFTGKYYAGFNSSAPGHRIKFNVEVDDNNTYLTDFPEDYSEDLKQKLPRNKQMLIELTDDKEVKHIFPLLDGSFSFSNGMCYSNFLLPNNIKKNSRDFNFKARLMDFSGNKSKETSCLTFKMVKNEPQNREIVVDGKLIGYSGTECSDEMMQKEINIDGKNWLNISSSAGCRYLDVYLKKGNILEYTNIQKRNTSKKKNKLGWLKQNTPNPTSESTAITYYLSHGVQSASLKIYNMSGIELQSIALEDNGQHSITVNTATLTPGVYLYTLIANGKTIETKKMVIQ